MLRIHRDALMDGVDGLRRGEDPPFTGLAYCIDADGVLASILQVDAGQAVGASVDWIALPPGGQRVDLDCLDAGAGCGPLLLGGEPFSGVAYTFEADGVCTAEALYAAGYPTETSGRAWYPSGALKAMTDPVGTVTCWFEDGSLQYHAVGADLRYNVIVGGDGHIEALYVQDATLCDVPALQRQPFGADVRLMGAGVDGALLAALPGLAQVPTLRLTHTGVSLQDWEVLMTLTGVRDLHLDENPAIFEAEAEALAHYDDWTVWLDGSRIAGRMAV